MEVIKKCRVLMSGSIPIGPEAIGLTLAHEVPAQVQLIDQADGITVLEIICSCGRKTYIQCDMENIQDGANETATAKNEQEK